MKYQRTRQIQTQTTMKPDEGPISHNGRMVDRSRIVDGLCAIADCLDGFEPENKGYYQEVIEAAKDHLQENVHARITLTNDDTRDITIHIMDHLVEKLQWEPEHDQYPYDLQDEIHGIINKALEVKE